MEKTDAQNNITFLLRISHPRVIEVKNRKLVKCRNASCCLFFIFSRGRKKERKKRRKKERRKERKRKERKRKEGKKGKKEREKEREKYINKERKKETKERKKERKQERKKQEKKERKEGRKYGKKERMLKKRMSVRKNEREIGRVREEVGNEGGSVIRKFYQVEILPPFQYHLQVVQSDHNLQKFIIENCNLFSQTVLYFSNELAYRYRSCSSHLSLTDPFPCRSTCTAVIN